MLRILFLCTGNSCRSQMAEGWTRHLLADRVEPYSAGIETHGLNPDAVRVMAEAGVDISSQHSKLVDDLRGVDFDYVVTVCDHASESCPVFPGRAKVVHHSFDDPPRLAANATTESETPRPLPPRAGRHPHLRRNTSQCPGTPKLANPERRHRMLTDS